MAAFEGAATVIWLFWLDLGQQHWRAAFAARWSHNWIRVRGCRVKNRHNKLPYAGGSITELSAVNASGPLRISSASCRADVPPSQNPHLRRVGSYQAKIPTFQATCVFPVRFSWRQPFDDTLWRWHGTHPPYLCLAFPSFGKCRTRTVCSKSRGDEKPPISALHAPRRR
jgi:hypothetical protein